MLKRLTDIVLYSSLFISLGSSALVARTYLIFDLEIDWIIILFVFFSTLFTYNISKIIPLWSFWGLHENESYAYNERNLWNVKHKDKLLYISIFSLAALLVFVVNLNQFQLIFISHLGLISVLYAAPIFLGKSLRTFPLLKIFLIAYVWAAIGVMPIFNGLESISYKFIFLFIDNFCFILAITIPFDIRDFSRDQTQSVKTIPTVFGIQNAKIIAILLLLISSFLSHLLLDNNHQQIIINIVISVVAGILIINSKEKSSEVHYLGLIDGILLLKLIPYFV